MRSFLKEIENKFMELEDYCDACDRVKSQCVCEEEIEEQNVTGAIAGFNTPAAFAKPGKWHGKKAKYESADKATVHNTVDETMERKYEELIESYRSFATGDSKLTPEQKVKNTIKEVAKKLQEIETLVNHTSRLKTESGLSRSGIGPAADKALTKISERLTKIAERVRSLGE
jgi:hypothetical protein